MEKKDLASKKLPEEVEKLNNLQKDYQKVFKTRQRLDVQLNENKAVKTEIDILEPGATVYKLIGPVLVKQDLEEAKQNVNKRLDYINAELKRNETGIKNLEEKVESQKQVLNSLQQQMMAMKA